MLSLYLSFLTTTPLLVFPVFSVAAIICMLAVYCVVHLVLVRYQPSGNFLALDNLHNVLSFPVGLIAIYAYTMFNFLMNDCLEGNSKRFTIIIIINISTLKYRNIA